MGRLDLSGLPDRALVLIGSAPIIYFLENHPRLATYFAPLFEAHDSGDVRFAVTTVTLCEVLTGPLKDHDDATARRYRSALESWRVIDLNADIAESAARLRVSLRLKLPDAIQVASALAINAYAIATHDRDFSRVRSLRVLG